MGLRAGAAVLAASLGPLSTTMGCLGIETEDPALLAKTAPTNTAIEFEEKLSRYFACRRTLEPRMRESHRDYRSVLEADGKRLSDHAYHFGVDRSTFRTCRVALADAEVMPPSRPILESTAKAMMSVAMEYADRSRVVGRAPAPGQRPHLEEVDVRLELDWERFEIALDGFVEQLEQERADNDPRLLEELSELDELRFRVVAVTVHARPLMACLLREPSPAVGECDLWRGPFDEATEVMQKVLGARVNVFWSDAYRTNAAALAEVVDDAFKRLDTGPLRTRDRARLHRTHSDLVRDAETLRLEFF